MGRIDPEDPETEKVYHKIKDEAFHKKLEYMYIKGLTLFDVIEVFNDNFEEIYKEKRKEFNKSKRIYEQLRKDVKKNIFSLKKSNEIIDHIDLFENIFYYERICQEKMLAKAKSVHNIYNTKGKGDFVDVQKAKQVLLEDIVDISKFRKARYRLSGQCPFHDHNDSSPSFIINISSNTYHCFGCGRSGDSIQFVRDYHGMGFVDAVKYLLNETK